ncbi:hypothetical protein J4474_00810 [Candidatus Pacearchaeota archaeon]|nr:hypothetical protein [Candidatus Pacearchaeota archaeon]
MYLFNDDTKCRIKTNMVNLSDLAKLRASVGNYVGQAKEYAGEARGQFDEGMEFLKNLTTQYAGKYSPIWMSAVGKATMNRGANLAVGLLSRLGSKPVKVDEKKAGELFIEYLVNGINSEYPQGDEIVNVQMKEYPLDNQEARFKVFGQYSEIVRNEHRYVFGIDKVMKETGHGDGKEFNEKMDLVIEGIVRKCNAKYPTKFKAKKGKRR